MIKKTHMARLADIRSAIEDIDTATEGVDFKRFEKDSTIRHAVVRCLEIISEASRDVPGEVKERHPGIPWQQVMSMGNLLRHEYGKIDYKLIWKILESDLSALKTVVSREIEREQSLRQSRGRGH